MPEAAARRDLWAAHLGDVRNLDPRCLDRLAVAVDLTGGHIRNIVLTAAARACSARRVIQWDDLVTGTTNEYAKLGRTPPVLS